MMMMKKKKTKRRRKEEKKKKKLITWKIGNLGLGNFQVSARPSGKEGGGWISKTDRQTHNVLYV